MPPMSRSRSWRTISSAASRLFRVTVSSRLPPGTGELAGVDVDDGHRLGAVDDQRAAGGQPDLAVQRLGELLVDPVRGEDVLLVGPAGQPVGAGRARRGRRTRWIMSQASSPATTSLVKSSLKMSRTTRMVRSGSP